LKFGHGEYAGSFDWENAILRYGSIRYLLGMRASGKLYKAATGGRGLCATPRKSPPSHQRRAIPATTGRGFMGLRYQ